MLETFVPDWLSLWFSQNWVSLLNVIMIDVVLAGDNAIVVGLAASQVAPQLRSRVIFWGIAGAVVLRIAFAGVTTQLLQIIGIMLAGGLLLLWVCWKMYRQILQHSHQTGHSLGAAAVTTGDAHGMNEARLLSSSAAIWQIVLADVSMSLDNVLAVAGAAKGNTAVLVIGLAVAVVLMAAASRFIASLLSRFPLIMWVGLAIILYVAIDMILDGAQDVSCKIYTSGCEMGLGQWLQLLMHQIVR
jgi:YjbE family integral membrane protein